MKILHTSDWHLGRYLYRQKRYEEFEKLLEWLADIIEKEKVDALVVAGDIFDNSTPSNLAQKLYYRFLAKVANGSCRNIIMTAGNHDSPSFLNAPSQLLEALNVFVVGSAFEAPEDEILMLKDKSGKVDAIVCAVPYLRERDVRKSEVGETASDKETLLIEGIKEHYMSVCELAEARRSELQKKQGNNIPIIATGHLFTAGGKTAEGDGVRELYIGSIGHIKSDIFPDFVDYVALGHLHTPQRVGGRENIRYSGSPIPMSFGEGEQAKSVVIVEFNDEHNPSVITLSVPLFQKLEKISGPLNEIRNRIIDLKSKNTNCWLEIEYTGQEIVPDLKEQLDELIEDSGIQILRVINRKIIDKVLSQNCENETLDDLDETDVFERCMEIHDVSDEQRNILRNLYKEVLYKLHNQDDNEE